MTQQTELITLDPRGSSTHQDTGIAPAPRQPRRADHRAAVQQQAELRTAAARCRGHAEAGVRGQGCSGGEQRQPPHSRASRDDSRPRRALRCGDYRNRRVRKLHILLYAGRSLSRKARYPLLSAGYAPVQHAGARDDEPARHAKLRVRRHRPSNGQPERRASNGASARGISADAQPVGRLAAWIY